MQTFGLNEVRPLLPVKKQVILTAEILRNLSYLRDGGESRCLKQKLIVIRNVVRLDFSNCSSDFTSIWLKKEHYQNIQGCGFHWPIQTGRSVVVREKYGSIKSHVFACFTRFSYVAILNRTKSLLSSIVNL